MSSNRAKMGLRAVPVEILLTISHFLEYHCDLNALARVNRHFHTLFNDLLYQRYLKSEQRKFDLYWAVSKKKEDAVRSILRANSQNPFAIPGSLLTDRMAEIALDSGPSMLNIFREYGVDFFTTEILFSALQEANTEVVEYLLENGTDPEPTSVPEGRIPPRPLSLAASEGYLDIVELLVDAGADARTSGGRWGEYAGRPLHNAADGGEEDVVRFLLERGGGFPAESVRSRYDPILAAAEARGRGGARTLECLLEYSTHPEIRDGASMYPAIYGRMLERPEVVKVLLKLKDWIRAPSNQDERSMVLALACVAGDIELLRRGIEAGWDLNARVPLHLGCETPGNRVPLDLAVENGHYEAIELLLSHGANPQGSSEGYALKAAAGRGDERVVSLLLHYGGDDVLKGAERGRIFDKAIPHEGVFRLLLEHGANPLNTYARSDVGVLQDVLIWGTAAQVRMLLERGYRFEDHVEDLQEEPCSLIEILARLEESKLDLFIEHGYDFRPDAKNPKINERVILDATAKGNVRMLQRLIDFGFDVHYLFSENLLSVAAQVDSSKAAKLVDFLLQLGLDLDGKDASGRTPLFQAIEAASWRSSKLLLDCGADPLLTSGNGSETWTPLAAAANFGRSDLVKMVLEAIYARKTPSDVLERHVLLAQEKRNMKDPLIMRRLVHAYWRARYPVPDE